MGVIMALIRGLFMRGGVSAIGQASTDIIGAIRPNATRQLELGHDAFAAVQAEHTAEFRHARSGWFDAFVNGLNRLPRPILALGTLALFVYAMTDPAGFTIRMHGLSEVPEPLWWLLGAVVAFYFGARETHHLRAHRPVARSMSAERGAQPEASAPSNPALADWRSGGSER